MAGTAWLGRAWYGTVRRGSAGEAWLGGGVRTAERLKVITLRKGDDPADLAGVTKMAVGVSWDRTAGASRGPLGKLKRQVGTDLDLVCVVMQNGEPVRYAGLDSLDPLQNGSVIHTGDNQTGKGDGDDEAVIVDFEKIQSNVDGLVFIAAAFKKGSDFAKAANVSMKIYDSSDGKPDVVADYWPSLVATGNACAIAKATRVGNTWQLTVLNEMGRVTIGDTRALMRFAAGK